MRGAVIRELKIRAGRSLSVSVPWERKVTAEETAATSGVARKAFRRWERRSLSVNGGAQASGSVVTTEELQGGAGAASIFESTFEIGAGRGASRGIVSDRTDDFVEGERSEAVQAAGPISGDTVNPQNCLLGTLSPRCRAPPALYRSSAVFLQLVV